MKYFADFRKDCLQFTLQFTQISLFSTCFSYFLSFDEGVVHVCLFSLSYSSWRQSRVLSSTMWAQLIATLIALYQGNVSGITHLHSFGQLSFFVWEWNPRKSLYMRPQVQELVGNLKTHLVEKAKNSQPFDCKHSSILVTPYIFLECIV